MNAVKSFAKFRRENEDIKLQKAELKLFSEQYQYNGTLDCLGVYKNKLSIVDWKTGKADANNVPRIFDEYYAQVSAYVKAYNEVYNTQIEDAFIIVFAKDKEAYALEHIYKDKIDFHFENIFLPALKIYNAQKK
jgi:ATP-dependent exoDNAse (exonuclease V) beta subunit